MSKVIEKLKEIKQVVDELSPEELAELFNQVSVEHGDSYEFIAGLITNYIDDIDLLP